MIALPSEIYPLISDVIWQFLLAFLRVGALVSVLPAFGERTVPMRIKLVIALMFTLVVAPAVPQMTVPSDVTTLAGYAFGETVIGLMLGLGIRLFVLALQTAGSIAAQSTSLAQILGGAGVEPIPALGYILVVAGLALAVMSGLHLQAALMLIGSYEVFPAGQLPNTALLSEWGVFRIAQSFALAFTLAGPFVIASLIYNLTLGAINRAMPQLMVAFVGAPVITWGALFLLFVSAPILLVVWVEALGEFFVNPAGDMR
ncbi:MAG: flagellar biosynthetic protein FliR [Arenibacterium sp.]